MQDIENLLLKNLPRSFVLAAKDALEDADKIGNSDGKTFSQGLRSWATGVVKHCRMSERWFDAVLSEGGNPTPLKPNDIVVGQFGIFKVARHNVRHHEWFHKKKLGKKQTELANLNRNLMVQHVMGDFFKEKEGVTVATAFFVAIIDGIDNSGQPQVTNIQLCVPHPDLHGELYTKSLTEFLALYERPSKPIDGAWSTLKEQSKTQNDQGHQ